MSLFRLIFVSFLHHWRMNFAVALGAAAGTAVLTGALLVGDSMRGSLKSLALDRLGKIDEVLMPGRFFREKLADELKETRDYAFYGNSLAPAILLSASLENPQSQAKANRAEVIGCNRDFYDLFLPSPSERDVGEQGEKVTNPQSDSNLPPPRSNSLSKEEETANAHELDLNQPLAEKLGVKSGDEVVLRLPRPGVIPSDSPLGEKRDTVSSHRLTVRNILPAAGPGRFELKSSQQEPLNAFVPLDWLQRRLDQSGKVNALLLSLNKAGIQQAIAAAKYEKENGNSPSQEPTFSETFYDVYPLSKTEQGRRVHIAANDRKASHGAPSPVDGLLARLVDYGIHIEKTPQGYLNVTSDRMILPSDVVSAMKWLKSASQNSPNDFAYQPIFTYLANSIADDDRRIPYSTITAIDFLPQPPLGPFKSPEGETLVPLGENEIAINSWAADELHAKMGDSVKISFFEPESVHGAIREKTVELKLTAIVKLAGAAEDRRLTPAVKGITDELTMADWDPPFPFDAKRIRPQDEKYWDDYGPTPKAFVSFATGKKLWGSRFGEATSIRVSNSEQKPLEKTLASDADRLDKYLRAYLAPASFGFVWQPVKLQGLAAAQGTTPFNVLFLCFSFFIIVSAMMLVLLLFKLGVERRAAEIGILLAVGWKPKQVRRLLIREGILTAVLGGAIGVPLGIGYAALMLWGLQTLWIAAIVAPFLSLFITPESLAIGFFAGFFMAMLAILFAVRKISRLAPRKLLAGFSFEAPSLANGKHGKGVELTNKRFSWLELLWIIFLLGNIFAWFFARRSSELEAGMFFGSGTVMLILTLLVIRNRLRRGAIGQAVAVGRGNLFRLAMRNAARNPGRSVLTVGLVASACFLIVAVSAFRLDPSQQTPRLDSGNGGFTLVAESSQPIFHDLDTPDGRAAMGFSDEEETLLGTCKICCLRVRAGDDASCLNLYKPRSPRMLGLPTTFLERGGFAWTNAPDNCKNPWKLLDTKRASDAPVESLQPSRFSVARKTLPMIVEKNTANYSLNLWGGLGEIYNYPETEKKNIPLQIAAMLDNSIFQGDLLISEEALLKNFPETSGYRFFLVECPAEKAAEVQKVLENRLGDYGFAAETTGNRLARFLAVQNTYLSTFQSLGGLGLLLGTLGLAVVQLRNVMERRGELALLRAVGFERKQLAKLVLMENAMLLILGLGSGTFAATVAVMPHYLTGNAPIPWASLVGILGLVFLVGTIAGSVAVRQIVKAPLLKSLRAER